MSSLFKRRAVIVVIICAVVGGAVAWNFSHPREVPVPVEQVVPVPLHSVIGTSVEGRTIDAYTYGHGPTHLAIVGGIHGGYEWNTVVLAYQLMDYLKADPTVILDNLSVTIVPDANPDGVHAVLGTEGRFTTANVTTNVSLEAGRFNAHNVDINRNFDCKWQPNSVWKGQATSAGTAPFSEPEARAIRDFVDSVKPVAVAFLHSKSGTVYASQCKDGTLKETTAIMNAYAKASGYKVADTFDAYAVTGDAEGWLASIGIPAITVELETHDSVEFERNKAGILALFAYYKNTVRTSSGMQ